MRDFLYLYPTSFNGARQRRPPESSYAYSTHPNTFPQIHKLLLTPFHQTWTFWLTSILFEVFLGVWEQSLEIRHQVKRCNLELWIIVRAKRRGEDRQVRFVRLERNLLRSHGRSRSGSSMWSSSTTRSLFHFQVLLKGKTEHSMQEEGVINWPLWLEIERTRSPRRIILCSQIKCVRLKKSWPAASDAFLENKSIICFSVLSRSFVNPIITFPRQVKYFRH